ncbi:MAG: hypothetical protein A3H96_08415 [Acidobacteria bacterium RIFCSPLOWO2_02_FULL_67_36]|nr:MAG: hypothetical protein A3H96_08415 [Acidobacteria bacterium RIFCSPLOWO2_02_FULL_67_36]OFW22281.1 MAG: hypothetical protein A3G21_01695 [Acidobacteria bacterium RIFCSPLOWO2_12_FULL_66_21]
MRRIFGASVVLTCLVAFGAPAAAQEPPSVQPPTGRISGRVVAADTGKPIRWAVVRMVTPQGRQMPAATDAQGRFQYGALAAGRYTLDVRADRYLPMQFGGQPYDGRPGAKPIDLGNGEQFDKADFAMPRASAVEGHVVDEFGDPAPNIFVQLSRLEYAAGRRRLMPIGGPNSQRQPTDDRGHFRVYGLQPADYYISALSGAFTEQNEVGGFAPTYYPGTPDVASAQRIRVGVAKDATGLTIQLVPAKTATLSGRMLDASRTPFGRGTITLSPSDRLGISDFMIARAITAADGSFTFRNVPPGSYTLQGFGRQVSSAGNLGASEFGWLLVSVDGVNQADLVLSVAKGPSLKGRIVLEETDGPPLKPTEVNIGAVPVDFDSAPLGGGPPPSVMRDDWTFEVSNLSGHRVLRVATRSPAWSLKRVTLRGSDVTDTAIDFTKEDVEDVEIVLTSRAPSVSGAVTDESGKPSTEYSVVIFASDKEKWTDRSRFLVFARPSQDGRFKVPALPPEEYLAVALPFVQGLEWQDPDYLERLRPLATHFFLAEGEAKTLTLKMSKRP